MPRDGLMTSACMTGFRDVAGVLVLSAIPFAAVTALAESDLGRELQARHTAIADSSCVCFAHST